MSPCTKKLSDIKGKRFKKYVAHLLWSGMGRKPESACANKLSCSAGKPQSLFAKLGKKSYEQSSSAGQNQETE